MAPTPTSKRWPKSSVLALLRRDAIIYLGSWSTHVHVSGWRCMSCQFAPESLCHVPLQSSRRLLQDSNLVQPGVRVTSKVETTQQLATSVGQSIDQAIQSNQIAQVLHQLWWHLSACLPFSNSAPFPTIRPCPGMAVGQVHVLRGGRCRGCDLKRWKRVLVLVLCHEYLRL